MAGLLSNNHFKMEIADDYKSLCEVVVQRMLGLSNQIIAKKKKFTLVLSGGATPKGIYQWMTSPSYRNKFQWDKMHFFWSDERWSFPEDQNRNYRMVYDTLLSKVNIPLGNIHPIPTENGDIEASASLYEKTIVDFFDLKKDEFPVFDLVLLGIGQDGHTSSLFPGNPALLVKDRLVVATTQIGIPEPRITVTLPVINNAQDIFFLVSGFEKADIVHEVLENASQVNFPASEIKPSQGKLYWFLDKDAASQLALKRVSPKRIGIAADHEGYQLKEEIAKKLREANYEVIDFGDHILNPDDDYPDFVVPLARAVAALKVDRGVAICGSGVGACIAANKVAGVRACLINEEFSARQGVEDDHMNVICLGSAETNKEEAWKLVSIFLAAHFSGIERHQRRLDKIAALEG